MVFIGGVDTKTLDTTGPSMAWGKLTNGTWVLWASQHGRFIWLGDFDSTAGCESAGRSIPNCNWTGLKCSVGGDL